MSELPDPTLEPVKPAVPDPMWLGGPPKFENRDDQFERFLQVRALYTEDLTYRRDRQWEILKWVFASLLVIIGGLLTLKAKSDVHLSFASTMALTFVIFVVGMLGIYRILHDGGVMSVLCDAVFHMEASAGLSMDTRPGKLWPRIKSLLLGIRTAPKSPAEIVSPATIDHKQAPFWSGLLGVYVVLVSTLMIGAIVILWSELYAPPRGTPPTKCSEGADAKSGPADEHKPGAKAKEVLSPVTQGQPKPNVPQPDPSQTKAAGAEPR